MTNTTPIQETEEEMIKKFGNAPYEWENELHKRFVKTHHVEDGELKYDYESVEADPKDMTDFIISLLQRKERETIKRVMEVIDNIDTFQKVNISTIEYGKQTFELINRQELRDNINKLK